MIQCPSCRSVHPTNTLYCTECGLYLGKGVPTGPLAGACYADEDAGAVAGTASSAAYPTVILQIAGVAREVALTVNKELLLGRPDASTGLHPDLDLTPFGGLDQGVSRRHLRLSRYEDQIVVEDLGSANGTFWNGQRLAPFQARSVRDGDELRLGRLVMRLRVTHPAGN